MALKTVIPFPIFAPNLTTSTSTTSTTTSTTTVIRFSRWNNANADKFNDRHRAQQLIESDLRRHRRFQSALNITNSYNPDTPTPSEPPYKSTGTPSLPSVSSISGRKSKYSKSNYRNPNPNANANSSVHPAFRKVLKRSKLPRRKIPNSDEDSDEVSGEVEVKVSEERGLSYVIPGAPFEYMYSYTETPKGVKPLALREAAVAPFAPGTMPRPWTGRKPLDKKILPEFDSFKLPPAGKRGVKTVQRPGPYLAGDGPRYVMKREEVLGAELTVDEVKELVDGCRKTRRQLNMGRDGLTHNMLDNIHAHWKRRRVCKIKCKGVCTVDMDNVCLQLEEKTGGKIIYRRGGSLFLFRGRNYNYKTRPRFPLMLWKPVSPVYPRLVKRIPEGLTIEEVTDMRKRGRDLIPICKLGKNGVYVNLVKSVREAFEVCDLVRINCEGLNPSDFRKIGAKLKDLVPCVLISFEREHILMWRGTDWTSSLGLPEGSSKGYKVSESDKGEFLGPESSDPSFSDDEQDSESTSSNVPNCKTSDEIPALSEVLTNDSDAGAMGCEDTFLTKNDVSSDVNGVIPNHSNNLGTEDLGNETTSRSNNLSDNDINSGPYSSERESESVVDVDSISAPQESDFVPDVESISEVDGVVEDTQESRLSSVPSPCTEGVLFLLRQALDSGSAVILEDSSLNADIIYEKSVAFAQVAPPGPAFMHRPRKVALKKSENQESAVAEVNKAAHEPVPEKKSSGKTLKERKSPGTKKTKDFNEEFLDVVPQGSLEIDELAKLLA